MPTLAELPPDAISMGLLEAGRHDELVDGWVHEKLAPATIIAIATRGRYEVHSGGYRTIANEGEAFLTQDGAELQIIHHARRRGETMRARWLHVRFMLFETIDLVSLLTLPPKVGVATARSFEAVIDELHRMRDEPGSSHPFVRQARTLELGFRVLGLLTEFAPVNQAGTALLQHADLLAPVLTFIKNHLSEALTVDDLARAAHLSRSRFFSFFHERMGLAPMAYVKEVRLAEARKWLIASEAKLPRSPRRPALRIRFTWAANSSAPTACRPENIASVIATLPV